MPKTFKIEVRQTIEVELDEAKFDDAFMAEFRQYHYPFFDLKDHAKHIAQLQARGAIDVERTVDFVEGYGRSEEMGIKARVVETDIEAVQ